jgi:hypothetical protein
MDLDKTLQSNKGVSIEKGSLSGFRNWVMSVMQTILDNSGNRLQEDHGAFRSFSTDIHQGSPVPSIRSLRLQTLSNHQPHVIF